MTAICYAFVTIVFVCVWYFSLVVWYLVPFFMYFFMWIWDCTYISLLCVLMSETCWAHNKWNKIASDIKLVFHSSIRPIFVLLWRDHCHAEKTGIMEEKFLWTKVDNSYKFLMKGNMLWWFGCHTFVLQKVVCECHKIICIRQTWSCSIFMVVWLTPPWTCCVCNVAVIFHCRYVQLEMKVCVMTVFNL